MFFDLSDKQSLTTKVYNHIRNGILDGSYKDGDFLVGTGRKVKIAGARPTSLR